MKPRNALFFLILLTFAPVWIVFLILKICWGIADNFYSQINKGYYPLLK